LPLLSRLPRRVRSSPSAVPHPGTFHTLYTRACGTRSYISPRWLPLRLATQASWRVVGGPAGMSPKYFSTRAFTSSASTSPATTTTALAAP
jgi:hypothetical protein